MSIYTEINNKNTMFLYLLVFFLSSFFFYLGQNYSKYKKFFYSLALVIPIILATFRGIDVGTDTIHYKEIYDILNYENGYIPIVEPLFYIITKIAKLFNSFSFVLFCYQALTICFIFIFTISYDKFLKISFIFLLYYLLFYNASLNIMRQITAAAYLLYISKYLINDNNKTLFSLLSIFGVFIHSTELIGAFFYLIIYSIVHAKSKYKKLYIVFYVVSLFSFSIFLYGFLKFIEIYGGDFLGGKASAYQDENAHVSISFIALTIFMFILWMLSKSYTRISEPKRNLLFMFIITDLFFSVMGSYNTVFSRFNIYFTIYYIYYIPLFCKTLIANQYNRRLTTLASICFCVIYWYWIIVENNSNQTIPYSMHIIM